MHPAFPCSSPAQPSAAGSRYIHTYDDLQTSWDGAGVGCVWAGATDGLPDSLEPPPLSQAKQAGKFGGVVWWSWVLGGGWVVTSPRFGHGSTASSMRPPISLPSISKSCLQGIRPPHSPPGSSRLSLPRALPEHRLRLPTLTHGRGTRKKKPRSDRPPPPLPPSSTTARTDE